MPGRYLYIAFLSLLCGATAAAAQDLDNFPPGEDAAHLEAIQADRPSPHQWHARWRLQRPVAGTDAMRFYQRLEWTAPVRLRLFLLTEKDPHEPAWNDFTALHAIYNRPDSGLQIALGDLRPGFAQGLVMARAPRRGGIPTLTLRRDSPQLGHRSSSEFPTLRGLGLRRQTPKGTLVLWLGRNRLDARLDTMGRAISLPTSGLHASPGQRASRHRLRAWVGGGRWHRQSPGLNLGATLVATHFDRLVDLRRPGKNPWALHGRGQWQWGLDLRTPWLAGELSGDQRNNLALLIAARTDLGPNRLESLLRYYAPGFHSLYGGSSSATGMRNELGYLIALAGGGSGRSWRLFTDLYRRLQPTSTEPLPGLNQTTGAQLDQSWKRRWRLQLAYQDRHRARWLNRRAISQRDQRLRLDLQRQTQPLRLQWRLEGRAVQTTVEAPEYGLLLSGQGTYQHATTQLTLHLSRYRTASYQSRIYEFERSLPGSLSLRPLYGRGWRFNVAAQHRLGSWTASLHYRYQQGPYCSLQIDWNPSP
ncbi:MAG: hypothetical protein GKR89_12995 [Candidatus Latescibacteria bacterium]|nr:hypothetical protein [Candidatus Latescibacterota bacterium]